jgi:hypothetical protein
MRPDVHIMISSISAAVTLLITAARTSTTTRSPAIWFEQIRVSLPWRIQRPHSSKRVHLLPRQRQSRIRNLVPRALGHPSCVFRHHFWRASSIKPNKPLSSLRLNFFNTINRGIHFNQFAG